MVELIVAVDENYGIGNKGELPWNCKEDLKMFKRKTKHNVIIFGRKTHDNLPILKNRVVYCFSRDSDIKIENIIKAHNDNNTKIFIGGGKEIYKLAIEMNIVDKIHISFIKGVYECDTFFESKWLNNYVISDRINHENFTEIVMSRSKEERQYLDILSDVLSNGVEKIGRNGTTLSMFGKNLTFDLRNGFPLLTTKKMFFRGVVEELLFFLRSTLR